MLGKEHKELNKKIIMKLSKKIFDSNEDNNTSNWIRCLRDYHVATSHMKLREIEDEIDKPIVLEPVPDSLNVGESR